MATTKGAGIAHMWRGMQLLGGGPRKRDGEIKAHVTVATQKEVSDYQRCVRRARVAPRAAVARAGSLLSLALST